MKNVIEFKGRRKENTSTTRAHAPAEVIDMTEKRNEILSQERRQVRRTILREFLGTFALVPRKGLMRVNLYDISENGLSFDVDVAAGKFMVGEEVAIRIYLSQETYFPFTVKVSNVRHLVDEGTFRHGVNLQKDTLNGEALLHFTRFLESVSASLQTDRGDIIASTLVR